MSNYFHEFPYLTGACNNNAVPPEDTNVEALPICGEHGAPWSCSSQIHAFHGSCDQKLWNAAPEKHW